jgi:hypothetical protein
MAKVNSKSLTHHCNVTCVCATLSQSAAVERALEHLQSRMDVLRRRRLLLQQLLPLLQFFNPVCFLLGWMVRRCYWECREPYSGHIARQLLLCAYNVLLQLHHGRERRSEYLRSMSIALTSWTAWHDSLPACAFVEECNEALLSRLSHVCTRNPSAATADEVNDLFVLLRVNSGRLHDASEQLVRQSLVDTVDRNLRWLSQTDPNLLTFVPWTSAKTCRGAGQWDVAYSFPQRRQLAIPDCIQHMKHFLRVARQAEAPSVEVCDWLNRYAPHEFEPSDPGDSPAGRATHEPVTAPDENLRSSAASRRARVIVTQVPWVPP